ncbi:flavin-containing monooxygenase [Cryptococcus wingfieldii CBS 7118]|uniref:Flavin-containing monooxygenase n=1 Tax=Cryptococcus wingfieldii CBS 7118 TaxID=1295528 RepID=A0A1E3JWH0_9TREE|nr:flavin-containing monooxygenase [Cryptococcus wingfieldii CBS 7118]ODO05209.1 flavin-containing monooxygenase [Cryptococcus wingfieldii CBS 7118]
MSPTAISDNFQQVDFQDLKSKVVEGHVELEETPKPSVADDFMYDFKYNHSLPTTDALGVSIPEDADPQAAAEELLAKLSQALGKGDAQAFTGSFLDYGVWRDKLAFSWDYRTFNWAENISQAAADLLPTNRCGKFEILKPALQKPYPDLGFLQFILAFDTPLTRASGLLIAEGWKIWTLHTVAASLLQFPEVDPSDGHMTGSVSWENQRAADDDQIKPDVLVAGGGQNGLAIAARLKALGVSNLIIERNAEIGEIWRKRYEYLADHLPYFPFPKQWPTYTSAQKLGIFMQWYASALELPVWTKSTITKAEQDVDGKWTVEINKDGETRVLHPKHVVSNGLYCSLNSSYMSSGHGYFTVRCSNDARRSWYGQVEGNVRHSTANDSSRDWVGKKVLVVGTSSSGFHTAYDCAGVDIVVTILQRSPTYVMSLTHSVPRGIGNYEPKKGLPLPDFEEQDRLFHSTPLGPGEPLARRNCATLEKLDKELLDGLHAKGLKTYAGQRGTGQVTLGSTRNGGFYFEAGACEQIIKGKIKVEQGFVESFTGACDCFWRCGTGP